MRVPAIEIKAFLDKYPDIASLEKGLALFCHTRLKYKYSYYFFDTNTEEYVFHDGMGIYENTLSNPKKMKLYLDIMTGKKSSHATT